MTTTTTRPVRGPGWGRRGGAAVVSAVALLATLTPGAIATATGDDDTSFAPNAVGGRPAEDGDIPRATLDTPPLQAYVGVGEALDFSATLRNSPVDGTTPPAAATLTITAPDGTVVHTESVSGSTAAIELDGFVGATSATAGVWQVALTPDPGNENQYSFQWELVVRPVTAAPFTNDISGRIFTDEYRARQAGGDGPYNVTMHYLSSQGVQYRADFLDYNGVDSRFQANSLGLGFNGERDGATPTELANDCLPMYLSLEQNFRIDGSVLPIGERLYKDFNDCADSVNVYRVLLDGPIDTTLPATAPSAGGGTTWVNPTWQPLSAENLTYTHGGSQTTYGGTFTFDTTISATANVVVTDADTGQILDEFARQFSLNAGAASIDWDGAGISRDRNIAVSITLDKAGEIHFVNTDVEWRNGGVQVSQLNGPNPGDNTLSWDDSHLLVHELDGQVIYEAPGDCLSDVATLDPVGVPCFEPNPFTTGTTIGDQVNSFGGVHAWDWNSGQDGTAIASYGNVRAINEWVFFDETAQVELAVPGEDVPYVLKVNKEAGEVTEADGGFLVDWTVTVTNDGPGEATEVTVNDIYSEAFDEVVDHNASVGSFDPATGVWTVGDLAAEQLETLELTTFITDDYAGEVVVNTAVVENPANPRDPEDPEDPLGPCVPNEGGLPGDEDQCDEAEVELPPAPGDPVLAVHKDAVGEPVYNEDGTATITWTITAGNIGEVTAEGVFVTDTLPEQVDPATVEVIDGPTQGEFDPADLIWSVGTLEVDQTETLTISGAVELTDSEQVLVNQARIGNPELPPPGEDEECIPNDDIPGDTDQCDEAQTPIDPQPGSPDLQVAKETVSIEETEDGSFLATYTITAANFGDAAAEQVSVTEAFPAQADLDTVQVLDGPSQGEYDATTNVWAVGTLEVEQTETLTLSVILVPEEDTESFINTVRIGNPELPPGEEVCIPGEGLPGDTDQCDEVTDPVPGAPILGVNKVQVGDVVYNDDDTATITYLIEAGNTGTETAEEVSVTDVLPEQVDPATVLVVADPSQGEFDSATMVWSVGTLEPGQIESLSISMLVSLEGADGEFIVVNTALIGNPELPPPGEDEECIPNDDVPGDTDQCDFVQTPVDPEDPTFPTGSGGVSTTNGWLLIGAGTLALLAMVLALTFAVRNRRAQATA